jgi:hypothetical protein
MSEEQPDIAPRGGTPVARPGGEEGATPARTPCNCCEPHLGRSVLFVRRTGGAQSAEAYLAASRRTPGARGRA